MIARLHLNTCPGRDRDAGPRAAKKRFRPATPEHVIKFFHFVAEEVREISRASGSAAWMILVGRADLLEPSRAIEHWKARGIDLTALSRWCRCRRARHWRADLRSDAGARRRARLGTDQGRARGDRARRAYQPRSTGAQTSTAVSEGCSRAADRETARRGGLEEGSISVRFRGSAGQSFGAWLAPGVSFTLDGEANDYTGKGLSGGTVVVRRRRRPPTSLRTT